MSIDTSSLLSPEELFAGRRAKQHLYNNEGRDRSGKDQMYEIVEEMILDNAGYENSLRLMSLPGKFWRFEMRLTNSFFRKRGKRVNFTAFERDHNIILSGAGYMPNISSIGKGKVIKPGFRQIESLGVEYFKTSLGRWLSMDVNSALTLNDSLFNRGKQKYTGECGMMWWLKKFCGWDAVWLDYYGPASTKIGEALSNLYFHCRQECTPVAVTILKGRENDQSVDDRKQWLIDRMTGVGSEFQAIDYYEYNDGGATMCNIAGLLMRK